MTQRIEVEAASIGILVAVYFTGVIIHAAMFTYAYTDRDNYNYQSMCNISSAAWPIFCPFTLAACTTRVYLDFPKFVFKIKQSMIQRKTAISVAEYVDPLEEKFLQIEKHNEIKA